MSTFDLEPYRAQSDGWFPSQYVASLVWLAAAVVLAFVICTLLVRWAHSKGKPFPPWVFIPAWMVLFALGAVGFYVTDHTNALPRMYTYTYYKPAVNADLRDWIDRRYGVDLSIAQATRLKYNEAPAFPLQPAVVYPTVRVDGAGRIKLEPIRKEGSSGLVLTGIGYERGGKIIELPRD